MFEIISSWEHITPVIVVIFLVASSIRLYRANVREDGLLSATLQLVARMIYSSIVFDRRILIYIAIVILIILSCEVEDV